MPSRTQQFQEQPQDLELWKKLYYQHQQEYIRNKLKAIKYLWQGKSRPEVAEHVGCSYKTLTSWIDQFIQGGLVGLTRGDYSSSAVSTNARTPDGIEKDDSGTKANGLWHRPIHMDGGYPV
jgi:hypothetical protein